MKMFLAAVLGAIVMFFWSFVAHTFLPLGETGVSEIPNEATVTAAMQGSIGDKAGFYIFPGPGLAPDATRAEKEKAMGKMAESYQTKPSGILIYHPPGTPFVFGKKLAIEFATELVQCLIGAFLLTLTRLASYGARAGFFAALGLLAAVMTNVSYWNWYSFPGNYTAAYMFMQLVGFVLAGLVIALVLKNSAAGRATS